MIDDTAVGGAAAHPVSGSHEAAHVWRVIPLETGSAGDLLGDGIARFEALATDPVPTLRWYRSTRPTIVLGRGQRDVVLAAGDDPVVSRFSGGGAVWLSPDVLSLDVLVPMGHRWATDDLAAVFGHVGRAWADALHALGVTELTTYDGPSTARRRGTDRERLLAAVCYATRGRGEVLWRGRKLVGLAQRRRRHGALVQCGLLRRWAPQPLLAALGTGPADREILAAAVGLDDVLADAPDDATVMAAVEQSLTTRG